MEKNLETEISKLIGKNLKWKEVFEKLKKNESVAIGPIDEKYANQIKEIFGNLAPKRYVAITGEYKGESYVTFIFKNKIIKIK